MFRKSFLQEILQTKSVDYLCSVAVILGTWTCSPKESADWKAQECWSVSLAAKGSIVLKYEPDPG